MSDLLASIEDTRKIASEIFLKSLADIKGNSEIEVREKILLEAKNYQQIFETGWYNPPTGGIGVLFDDYPFQRLKYDSLRKPEYEAKESSKFNNGSLGIVYSSFVDKKTGMLGDIGFSIYQGSNEKIKNHLRNSFKTIIAIAEETRAGMSFSELCSFAQKLFEGKFKPTKWLIVSRDITQPMNLGHTIPGSFGEKINFSDNIKEVQEQIRKNRTFIIKDENFTIPETCAFTIESRLEDYNDSEMPSVYFHLIVIFNGGKKTILKNFDKIFETINMSYLNNI